MRTLIAAAALCATAPLAPAQETGEAAAADPIVNQATMRHAVRSRLRQAGFTDVAFLDAAFVVAAVGPDGERVTMVIDAPETMIDAVTAQEASEQEG